MYHFNIIIIFLKNHYLFLSIFSSALFGLEGVGEWKVEGVREWKYEENVKKVEVVWIEIC